MVIKRVLLIISLSTMFYIIPLGMEAISQISVKASPSFRRDPFSLPSGIYHISKQPILREKKIELPSEQKPLEMKPSEIPLKLKAILIGEHIRLASINQRILTIGDEINGERILEIHSDRVILGKGKDRRTILLDQNPLKIKVE